MWQGRFPLVRRSEHARHLRAEQPGHDRLKHGALTTAVPAPELNETREIDS
jgi:hypothetical protein